ncbi:MAG: cell surface protein [Bacteroidetes bacterium HGW-Bacteroidetes-15]|nr:MAG: cell surface protein [Bacteroidetes bacterium HGW-Bacteroidetes-15]
MDEDLFPITPYNLYGSRGVFIVNEGNYLYGNGSLSYYDINSKEVINSVYSLANGVPLGDVAYSMTIYDGKGYIVVNNSSSIKVVDANTLLHFGTITDLPSPRHILFLNDESAMISDLYARGISIINPKTLSVVGKIKTGGSTMPFYQHSTENLVKIGNKVFTNCWSFDNKVLVISTESLAVIDSIEVGIQPLAMVKDKNNNLWVINDGGYAGNPVGHEIPSLMRINSQSHQVEFRLNFPSLNDIVGQIATTPAGDSLYFISNNIYKMSIDDTVLPQEPLIQKNGRNFRALGIDPITGDVYVSDAVDFMSEGAVYRYASNGAVIDTFDVGIIPGNFCFN